MKSTPSSPASNGSTLASYWYRRAFEKRHPGTHITIYRWRASRSAAVFGSENGIILCRLADIRTVVGYRKFFSIDITCEVCRAAWERLQR